jgi:E3 ubiquitin-protein ligase RAD18
MEIKIIIRHRWVAVYNANLDHIPALRKRAAELRSEMRRWEEDKRASRKEPLKTDITEYRVRTCLLSLRGLRH